MAQPQSADVADKKLTVFYDGGCPLCVREIGFYRRRKGADEIRWVDVSEIPVSEIGSSPAGEGEVAPGLSCRQALARFHVLDSDGRLVSGGEAFAVLWRALPGFRLLGRLCRVPPLPRILNFAYDRFLKIRPWLQARVRARRL